MSFWQDVLRVDGKYYKRLVKIKFILHTTGFVVLTLQVKSLAQDLNPNLQGLNNK